MPSLYLALRRLLQEEAIRLVGVGWDDLLADVSLCGRLEFDRRYRATRHHSVAFHDAVREMRLHFERSFDDHTDDASLHSRALAAQFWWYPRPRPF